MYANVLTVADYSTTQAFLQYRPDQEKIKTLFWVHIKGHADMGSSRRTTSTWQWGREILIAEMSSFQVRFSLCSSQHIKKGSAEGSILDSKEGLGLQGDASEATVSWQSLIDSIHLFHSTTKVWPKRNTVFFNDTSLTKLLLWKFPDRDLSPSQSIQSWDLSSWVHNSARNLTFVS